MIQDFVLKCSINLTWDVENESFFISALNNPTHTETAPNERTQRSLVCVMQSVTLDGIGYI